MNYLVTLNINDCLCSNSRNSMLDACSRWGCKFHEITENYVGDQNVCFNKLVGIKRLTEEADVDRLMYLDADMLIRSDAPNPLVLFNDDKTYAVRDCKDSSTEDEFLYWKSMVVESWLLSVHEKLKLDVDINRLVDTCKDWFFNAGMFLMSAKQNRPNIDLFIRNIPSFPVNGRIEQAMWNYILKNSENMVYIDRTWNMLEPDLSESMKNFIYHFTGFRSYVPTLKERILTYNWKV